MLFRYYTAMTSTSDFWPWVIPSRDGWPRPLQVNRPFRSIPPHWHWKCSALCSKAGRCSCLSEMWPSAVVFPTVPSKLVFCFANCKKALFLSLVYTFKIYTLLLTFIFFTESPFLGLEQNGCLFWRREIWNQVRCRTIVISLFFLLFFPMSIIGLHFQDSLSMGLSW